MKPHSLLSTSQSRLQNNFWNMTRIPSHLWAIQRHPPLTALCANGQFFPRLPCECHFNRLTFPASQPYFFGDAGGSAASPSVEDILNILKLHTVHIRFGSGLLVATCICAPTVSTTTATVAQQVQKESTPKLCLAAQCA